MTQYTVYLVNPQGFHDTLAEIGTFEANNAEEAKRMGEREVEELGGEILTAAGYNVNENIDEVKSMMRVYPETYKTGF